MIIVRCVNCRRLMRGHSRLHYVAGSLPTSTNTEDRHGSWDTIVYAQPCACHGDPTQKREEDEDEETD